MYEKLIRDLRYKAEFLRNANRDSSSVHNSFAETMSQAANAIERLIVFKAMWQGAAEFAKENKPKWIPVTERLPECEWGAEVGNIEWISCGMVFAGCFGRGGKYRDAYFRTWTDGTEGIDAKGADYWRTVTLPEPPKEET